MSLVDRHEKSMLANKDLPVVRFSYEAFLGRQATKCTILEDSRFSTTRESLKLPEIDLAGTLQMESQLFDLVEPFCHAQGPFQVQ